MSRLTAVTVLVLTGVSQAQWTQWTEGPGANGHWYRLTDEPLSWTDAEVAARSAGGHLVVIDSADENSFISETFAVAGQPVWIGLYQDHDDPNYSEPDGGWVWVNGATVGYTNWAPSEPNQHQGNPQDFAEMYDQDNPNGAGLWDDDQNAPLLYGVVERVVDPQVPAVSSWGFIVMMCGLATIGTLLLTRRRTQVTS